MHRFLVVCYETLALFLFLFPRFGWCNFLKAKFLQMMGARIGKRVEFYPGVFPIFGKGAKLVIEDDVDLALGVIIGARGGVEIGARTMIGFRSMIISANHEIPVAHGQIFLSNFNAAPIKIGADVWVGAHVVILPGVTIGEGAVVGAGSVVTKDIPAFAIAAGVPAKVIRMRD